MQIAGGISGFKAEPVRMLMVSSAAVERNAIIGDDAGQWQSALSTLVWMLSGLQCACAKQNVRPFQLEAHL